MKELWLCLSLGMALLLFASTYDGNMPKKALQVQGHSESKDSCSKDKMEMMGDNCCAKGDKKSASTKTTTKATKQYTCPMKSHQYITMSKKGKCPLCKMKLVVKKAETKQYVCPMKSHPKVYSKPGKCPLCGMKLVVKKKKATKEYQCPMKSHQYMVMSKKGKCPLCKMKLVVKKAEKAKAVGYVCPMKSHPKVYNKKGKCPLCGMKLVKKK